MTWNHPEAFWLLLALGGLIAVYVRRLRRVPERGVVRFPSLGIAAQAAAHARPFRRHVAAVAFTLAATAAIIGAAGPVVPWPAPTGQPVVLMVDVSRSMLETDIAPTRIDAAKAAALDFVQWLPRPTKVALVSFGNYATLVVPLTNDHARVQDGIRSLSVQLRTQLGNGLMEGIRAVAGEQATPSASAVGVLLTDGRASDGIPPLEAAQEARRRGVRVYTVGIGTAADPSTFRSGYFGVLDEPTLQAIAAETGGQYFHASETGRLRTIYRDLARVVGWERRPQEVTAVVAGFALALLVMSVLLRSWISPVTEV